MQPVRLPTINRYIALRIGRHTGGFFTVWIPDNGMMPNFAQENMNLAGTIGVEANMQNARGLAHVQQIANEEFLRVYGNNYLQTFAQHLQQQQRLQRQQAALAVHQQQQVNNNANDDDKDHEEKANEADDEDDDATVIDEGKEEEDFRTRNLPQRRWFQVLQLPRGVRGFWKAKYNLNNDDEIELAVDVNGKPLQPARQPASTIHIRRPIASAERKPRRRTREVIDVDALDDDDDDLQQHPGPNKPKVKRHVYNVDEDKDESESDTSSDDSVVMLPGPNNIPAAVPPLQIRPGRTWVAMPNVPRPLRRVIRSLVPRSEWGRITGVRLQMFTNNNYVPNQQITLRHITFLP